ncbi:transcriptional regulator NrdR [candidate division CSSED10-310 bacterium]|uniref:Transcriptional repressor NrdR n=1 Tax=candidate division CSSED10-310 bacterium TaxID=2855610 RepID=A0ABV6YSN2_UNCC1
MKCPFCQDVDDKVVDSRLTKDGTIIRRRRECLKCQRRYTTYEKVEVMLPRVKKKGGFWEPFDREKILSGLLKACEKRPLPPTTLENLIDEIERQLHDKLVKETTSQEIGEIIMEKLQDLDQVAYIRFASVYRQFTDVQQFKSVIDKLFQEQSISQ